MGVTYNWVSFIPFFTLQSWTESKYAENNYPEKKSSPSQLENFLRSCMPLKDYKNVGQNIGRGPHIGVSYILFFERYSFSVKNPFTFL